MKQPLDPNKTICVVTDTAGKVLARIAATDPSAPRRLEALAQSHRGIKVYYVEDAQAASDARLIGCLFGR